jgi:UDP:flavonoid glycosyltransferase YjiC (YdhE family)
VQPKDIIKQTVIVAPLDWGMGHATRCISLIRQFQGQGCDVIFAGIDLQIELIKKDFPTITTELIPGYDVMLDSTSSTYVQMLSQFKQMKRIAVSENELAEQLVEKYNADIVVSDNRFGFYAKSASNVFITHQLNPQLPVLRKRVRNLIGKYIQNFHHCWVPDDEANPICGKLLDAEIKIPMHYIGFLSRFEKSDVPKERDILAIVSGPEPERSRIQNKFFDILKESNKSFSIVTPAAVKHPQFVVNPSTNELQNLINSSSIVLSRGGYTTIMEMLKLEKRAYLIPTKGQYEQEYLADSIDHPLIDFIEEKELAAKIAALVV